MRYLGREERPVSSIEFGVTVPLNDIAGFARRAEQFGYDYLTCGEHLTFHGPQANAFISLAVAAGATERIRLLSTATLLPLYPAALAAKMVAMLDHASAGRFNLGVGIGGEFPVEFEAAGVPVRQRGARTDEALEVITRLLSQDSAAMNGRFNRFGPISIAPPPVQRPCPPIWIAGRKEAAMRRAARYGDAWMPYMYTSGQLAASLETIDRYLPEYGRPPGRVRGAVFTFVCVDPEPGRARQTAIEVVSRIYQQDFSPLAERYIVAGTAEACARRLQEYVDAGASAILTNLACPVEDMPAMMQRIAEDVRPALSPAATTMPVGS